MSRTGFKTISMGLAAAFFVALSVPLPSAMAVPGDVTTTPSVIPELPIEIETEVGPAGSLKQVPLFKKILELLEDPYAIVCPPDDPLTLQFDESSECTATIDRRTFFDPATGLEVAMPGDPLRVFNPCFNVITGQPLRLRPDGEINWDQPGLLFDPDQQVPVGPGNIPIVDRIVIGEIYTDVDNNLVVRNPEAGDMGPPNPRIPPDGTIIAVPACLEDGTLLVADEDDPSILEEVVELEVPVNETHFFRENLVMLPLPAGIFPGVPGDPPFVGRLAAEVLGKALFWEQQIGSDGVQACGTCHFQSGVDVRIRNQLNANTLGGDLTLQVKGPNESVENGDFPFHKLFDETVVAGAEDVNCGLPNSLAAPGGMAACSGGNVKSDANDVMSSMGVSENTQFEDVLVGAGAFITTCTLADCKGVAPLMPDVGSPIAENIDAQTDGPGVTGNKLRRIEPRHTPTMHAAAFNFDNFWDGRARHDYNGGSVFGPSDPFFHIYVNCEEGGEPDELRGLSAPDEAEIGSEGLCEWTEEFMGFEDGDDPVPVRIRFSSLASQAMGPPLSNFEMAFGFVEDGVTSGRNWQKIGKKLLQPGVTPLANQLVDVDDSRIGPFSNQGGSACAILGLPTEAGKPGLCVTYPELIKQAFRNELWNNANEHLAGTTVAMNNACDPGFQIHVQNILPTCDPFDGYVIAVTGGVAGPLDTNQFTQMEANFGFFFGSSVQSYEQLLIPDDTPWDRFNDANPKIGNAVGQPGEKGTIPIFSTLGVDGLLGTEDDILGIREAVTGSPTGDVMLVAGFGPDELFGFDIFAGGNITAALPVGPRNPATADHPLGVGSNPFIRTARCMLCHLGPEQSDHTNNVNAGLLQSGTEREFPFPFTGEPTGQLRLVTGISLAEELEENAQDGVEVENRNFILVDLVDDPATLLVDESLFDGAQVAAASGIAFQDNGIYNIGIRPTREDILRGGNDPFGFPLALSALAMKNLAGVDFEPCDTETEFSGVLVPGDVAACTLAPGMGTMTAFDPDIDVGGGLFEVVGEGFPFPLTGPLDCVDEDLIPGPCEQASINAGFETEPAIPMLPAYLAPWANNLPAGEGHPQTDELAFVVNTISPPPSPEYGEILFGSDSHCGVYDPVAFDPAQEVDYLGPDGIVGTADDIFDGVPKSPNFGWGPLCPQSQSAVPSNSPPRISVDMIGDFDPGFMELPLNGTWPFENRVARNGADKVPHLRNIELTGPYFHTGSYLTLGQVVEFYMRGGDFPLTNAEDRDPNLVAIDVQAFGFGTTIGLPPQFQDGIPDSVAAYGPMPDQDPPGCNEDPFVAANCTPEPATSTPAEARVALVKFMLALTDERVAFRKAPFDQPEIFPPLDGRAPANTGGRTQLLALSVAKTDGLPTCDGPDLIQCPNPDVGDGVPAVPCDTADPTSTEFCFLRVPATGRTGQMLRLKNFLNISSTVSGGPQDDHFDGSHVQGKFGSLHAGGKKKKKKNK